MKRLVITGAEGMLGHDVATAAQLAGLEVSLLTYEDLDITDAAQTLKCISERSPDAVINCAALTDVDGAETSAESNHAVNGAGAGNVAAAAKQCGAFAVHISSDYVFNGEADTPYTETAATDPQSVYGHSKLAGEAAVRAAAPDQHAIVRSSWLFGLYGRNFIDTILTRAQTHGELRVVADQIGCPTWTGHLAPALVEIATRQISGIMHVVGNGHCSWYELAKVATEIEGLDCAVTPVGTSEFPRPAKRPAFSALINTRPDVPTLSGWQEGVKEYLKRRSENKQKEVAVK